jgi:hypothetical protein
MTVVGDDVERATVFGFLAGLGAVMQRGDVYSALSSMRSTLCESHKSLCDDLDVMTKTYVRGGRA